MFTATGFAGSLRRRKAPLGWLRGNWSFNVVRFESESEHSDAAVLYRATENARSHVTGQIYTLQHTWRSAQRWFRSPKWHHSPGLMFYVDFRRIESPGITHRGCSRKS